MEDFIGKIIVGLLIALVVSVVFFLLSREILCWYFKINARLEEQRTANELLQNIFDALVQGNAVNAVTAGQIIEMSETQGKNIPSASVNKNVNISDIPDL